MVGLDRDDQPRPQEGVDPDRVPPVLPMEPARWGLDVLDDLAAVEHELARAALSVLYAAPPADDRVAELRGGLLYSAR